MSVLDTSSYIWYFNIYLYMESWIMVTFFKTNNKSLVSAETAQFKVFNSLVDLVSFSIPTAFLISLG
jgi:hypothetical protein